MLEASTSTIKGQIGVWVMQDGCSGEAMLELVESLHSGGRPVKPMGDPLRHTSERGCD